LLLLEIWEKVDRQSGRMGQIGRQERASRDSIMRSNDAMEETPLERHDSLREMEHGSETRMGSSSNRTKG